MNSRMSSSSAVWCLVACLAFSVLALFQAGTAFAGERQFLVILATSPKEYNLPCVPDPEDPEEPWCPERSYEYECNIPGPSSPEVIRYGICYTSCANDADCEEVSEAEGMTFVCSHLWEAPGRCVPDYPTPELIRKQYFDRIDDGIGSFAEYWEEISYGDVTISGTVTDWINLPWRLNPPRLEEPFDFPELPPGSGGIGRQEEFDNYQPMVGIDIDGDGFSDNARLDFAKGGQDTHATLGFPLWMPGERFIDMNEDGVWNGLDETMNRMDFFASCTNDDDCSRYGSGSICSRAGTLFRLACYVGVNRLWVPDHQPDLYGPWIDLNEDDQADNPGTPGECLYLVDDDNDGNPNCCPEGPGATSCARYPEPNSCPATRWEGPGEADIFDCNGNLIPDACDVPPPEGTAHPTRACSDTGWLAVDPLCQHCGGSPDELPWVEGVDPRGNPACVEGVANGIPDECEFHNATENCAAAGVNTETCDLNNNPTCVVRDLDIRERCEFDDANGNGEMDIVEPFENFLVRWNGFTWIPVDWPYIRDNYPGDANQVFARQSGRTVYGGHDPLSKIGGYGCKCSDGTNCVNPAGTGLLSVCPAGTHVQYDPPDRWIESETPSGSIKMQQNGIAGFSLKPSWYEQMWQEFYDTSPPPWPEAIPRMEFFEPQAREEGEEDRIIRRYFRASAGGTHGDGTGWIGCDDALDPFVVFEVWPGMVNDAASPFEEACNRPILPEEMNGLNEPLILYDGPGEFDDLPSSKYHRYGDGRLGEITSPFLNHIWGDDLGDGRPGSGSRPDGLITAAGPYATHVHGNLGYDAGNVLTLELLTVSDWNLDGLVDQGGIALTLPGTENYQVYRWEWDLTGGEGRKRLVEDCVEILDDVIDFDDFVDSVTLDHLGGGSAFATPVPYWEYPRPDNIEPSGICSGIVLLPENSYMNSRLGLLANRCAYHGLRTELFPIHNEDGLNDPRYAGATFPSEAPELSWNVFFHNLVTGINIPSCSLTVPSWNYQTAYAAHHWAHTWEGFSDMYDYDVFQAGAIENCPVAGWDIMADGGLVHPAPIMKERPNTKWAVPVDLGAMLTPGVDATLTLPPAEFHRDNSYYFLENESRPGERAYFWSAGSGFDERMPGDGMLIMHTDVTPTCQTDADCEQVPCVNGFCDGEVSNPDAPPPQQRSGTRPTYLIVQADGNGELEACDDRGDVGDPWPGDSGATRFNFNTTPAATWYAQNSWMGLDILDIVPDGSGSTQVTLNWVPTSIPSLRFINPPGGESVDSIYQVRFETTDVYGGTTIRTYYIEDEKTCSSSPRSCSKNSDCPEEGEFCRYETVIAAGEANFVGQLKKNTPGTNQLSMDWDIHSVPDGRYVLFAKLIPGDGSDGTEAAVTRPRSGRNNRGTGTMSVRDEDVNIDGNASRFETWTTVCIDAAAQRWRVHSSLSQPVLNENDPEADPYPRAVTGQPYTSVGEEVTFTITASDECLTQDVGCFALGDAFTFTTTGITEVSRAVTIINGQIRQGPTAVISALPLACPPSTPDSPACPPLTVDFNGLGSYDPNGEPLEYLWDFGEGGAPVNGPLAEYTFKKAGTFTVVLRVTNSTSGRFGETAVDIEVRNNSPIARISATPTSGGVPLDVQFSAAQSNDNETPSDQLVYQWNFGDGTTANNARVPGSAFQSIAHLYSKKEDGTPCTKEDPCPFVATLTVIDEGGKPDTDTVTIVVGNTSPRAVITHSALQGPDPLEVTFNAINSYDPDDDPLTVEWIWGDGQTDNFPLTGVPGATDGSVPHEYKLPEGETSATFFTRATVRDNRGGLAEWGPVTVIVSEATVGPSMPPRAIFSIDPTEPALGEPFTVDASRSVDRNVGGVITSWVWDWGDGTPPGSGVTATHTYAKSGTYIIRLTVEDNDGLKGYYQKTVIISEDGEAPGPDNQPPVASFRVNPTSGYAGATVFTFDASESDDPDGDNTKLSFRWQFGDAQTGAGAVVTHMYEQPNPSGYAVRLTVRDEKNASRATTKKVVVEDNADNQPPQAYIATGPRAGTAPVTLTFDGRNSYDPNDDPLEFRWEFKIDEELEDVLIGSVVDKLFSQPGNYTVELEVSDGRGGVDRAGPETIQIADRITQPDDGDEPPEQPIPDDGDTPDLSPVRRICGFGMIPGLFGSLLGLLAAMMVTRRRQSL